MHVFRERIRASLGDASLQAALDANAERRDKGRLRAFESLPDWRERRQRAHAVRAEVIAHLDRYLDQFADKARANGVLVHRAADAAQANQIVLKIVEDSPQRTQRGTKESFDPLGLQKETAQAGSKAVDSFVPLRDPRGSKLIAKSKSMVSEEIGLNHALEAAGHRAVETDLGEYIVQLRGEKPAHIITPAVHLRRGDVGRLFERHLGLPYTEDVPTLTTAARRALREVFLSADVGVSGVNFGVAETGALCLVTNEGNGRMVTTLPRVHIALMGMERLVRNLDDLALMLSLLARSATTQKLSAYTQLIQRPLDGQQRHVILLDNGRSRLRNSPLRESLYCIRCGACMNACPVFRELGGHAYVGADGEIAPYPGPIGAVVSPGLLGGNFVHLAQASSLCGACKDACPVDIDLPKMLVRVRAGGSGRAEAVSSRRAERAEAVGGRQAGEGLSRLAKIGLGAYARVARSPGLFAVSQAFAALTSHLLPASDGWIRLPAFTGWGYSKDFPRFAAQPFRKRFHREETTDAEVEESQKAHEPLRDLRSFAAQKNLVEQFTAELTALGGTVTRTTQSELVQKVIDFLKSHGLTQIHLEPGTLDGAALAAAGIMAVHAPDPSIRVGLTRAVCGLADTGSILVVDGDGSPLQASLLPEVHVAVLRAVDVLPSLEDAMSLPELRAARAAVFVTGPSRTADIEMTLTIGVHGPAEVHVFLIDEDAAGGQL